MAYISSSVGHRRPARLLTVAAVLALHALVWLGAGLRQPAAEHPDSNITYADLRFVEPAPEPVAPSAEPPPPVAPRPRASAPVVPRDAEPASDPPAPAAQAAEPLAPPTAGDMQQAAPIDMEAWRTAARDYERTRERSPIEKHREQLRREQHRDAAADAMAKAARGDCRSAYAGLSLLAVIPIIVDTVRDKGCKW